MNKKPDEILNSIKKEVVERNIIKINDIELRAVKLQQKMDSLRRQWDEAYNTVRNTDEWKERCNHFGVVHNYYFEDMLA